MKELISTNFFRTLQEASHSGIDESTERLQNEYEDFADLIFSFGGDCERCMQRERTDNRIVCHNMLVYTQVELSGLKRVSGKNTKISSFYVEKAIELVAKQMDYIADVVDCPLRHKTIRFNWVGNIIDYVEWVYGLHEFLNQTGDKVTLKTLFDTFNPIFGIELKEYAQYFMTIKSRAKGDRTTFLDLQKKLLMQRMVEPKAKQKK